MSRPRIAPDADDEPTLWDGDKALLAHYEVNPLVWNLVVAGVEFTALSKQKDLLQRDAVRLVALFLSVMGGRVEIPDEVVMALPFDAQVVRWRDNEHRSEIWELRKPLPADNSGTVPE